MRAFLLTLLLSAGLGLPCWSQDSQEGLRPIERENLLKALSRRELTEQQVIELVQKLKLNFEMTPADAEELRRVGAGETLITALWKNDKFTVKPGPPLNKDGIVMLLQNGVPSPRIERIIETRKAIIILDESTSKEIQDAGGTTALLGAIIANRVRAPDPIIKTPQDVADLLGRGWASDALERFLREKQIKFRLDEASRKTIEEAGGTKSLIEVLAIPEALVAASTKGFDELMAEAEKLRKASDYARAVEMAEDAKKLDRARPQPYAFIGNVYLYYLDSFPMARRNYSDAIDQGGQVEFRIYHGDDKSRITRRWSKCLGTLLVKKQSVHYRSDDGRHTIDLNDNQWNRVAKAGMLGSGIVITLSKGADKDEDEIHFFSARKKDEGEEEDLIVEMINK